jgi:CTP:molybdopterin cytidylyltransferase MocA
VAHIVGAVLAAGSGTRMGRPKADLVVDGARLIDRAVAALTAGGCFEVIAVVRADVTTDIGARPIVNPHPEDGLRSSLALAVAAADPDSDALAVILVDMPDVGADAIATVRSAWKPGRIAIARYANQPTGRWAHPIVMSLELWREALALAGPDEGARALLAANAALIDEIVVAGSGIDLDTAADIAAWNHRI